MTCCQKDAKNLLGRKLATRVVNCGAIFLYLMFFLLQRLRSWGQRIYMRSVRLSSEKKRPNRAFIHTEFDGINLKTSEKQMAKKGKSVFWGFK